MDPFYLAISLFHRKKYDECISTCNLLLQKNPQHKAPWELKMRVMTQRVYVDDIEADDGFIEDDDDLDTNRLATAPRAGTSVRTPATAQMHPHQQQNNVRPRTLSGRPLTGISRIGTTTQRPGSSMKSRTALRTGSHLDSARNIRLGTASMFALGDPTGPLFQTSRLNTTQFVDKPIAKALFQFLYFHEADVRKALDLAKAIADKRQFAVNSEISWWWSTQTGRCYIALGNPRSAEKYLRQSLSQFPHVETALLLARVYVKLDQPLAAIDILSGALEKFPDEMSLLIQQARILELMGNLQTSVRMYRHIAQIEPINTEALACIAVHHFYNSQPEMALLYYRRILLLGAHSCELFCNLGLCCLYGGQLDLVLACFQRAIRLATTAEQRADVWYNLSFVALTSGDFNLTRRCLRLCLSADGAHGAALNNLAVICAQLGQHAKAKSYLVAAKAVLPNSDEVEQNTKLMAKYIV